MKGGGCEREKFGALGAGADGAPLSCHWSGAVGTFLADGIGATVSVHEAREAGVMGGALLACPTLANICTISVNIH